jgi:hypothetical protein
VSGKQAALFAGNGRGGDILAAFMWKLHGAADDRHIAAPFSKGAIFRLVND